MAAVLKVPATGNSTWRAAGEGRQHSAPNGRLREAKLQRLLSGDELEQMSVAPRPTRAVRASSASATASLPFLPSALPTIGRRFGLNGHWRPELHTSGMNRSAVIGREIVTNGRSVPLLIAGLDPYAQVPTMRSSAAPSSTNAPKEPPPAASFLVSSKARLCGEATTSGTSCVRLGLTPAALPTGNRSCRCSHLTRLQIRRQAASRRKKSAQAL